MDCTKARLVLGAPLSGLLVEIGFIALGVAGWTVIAVFTVDYHVEGWANSNDQILWLAFVLAFEIIYYLITGFVILIRADHTYTRGEKYPPLAAMRATHMSIYWISAPIIVLAGLSENAIVNRVVLWVPFMLLGVGAVVGTVVGACVAVVRKLNSLLVNI